MYNFAEKKIIQIAGLNKIFLLLTKIFYKKLPLILYYFVKETLSKSIEDYILTLKEKKYIRKYFYDNNNKFNKKILGRYAFNFKAMDVFTIFKNLKESDLIYEKTK